MLDIRKFEFEVIAPSLSDALNKASSIGGIIIVHKGDENSMDVSIEGAPESCNITQDGKIITLSESNPCSSPVLMDLFDVTLKSMGGVGGVEPEPNLPSYLTATYMEKKRKYLLLKANLLSVAMLLVPVSIVVGIVVILWNFIV